LDPKKTRVEDKIHRNFHRVENDHPASDHERFLCPILLQSKTNEGANEGSKEGAKGSIRDLAATPAVRGVIQGFLWG